MTRTLSLVLLVGLLLGCEDGQQPPQAPPQPFAEDLLGLHNAARTQHGKPALSIDARLTAAAQKHADWMARTGQFSHTGEGGSQLSERIDREGYAYAAISENNARGQETPERVFEGWLNSRGHRDNLLGNYRDVGFGRAGAYWVACYGRPR